MTELADLRPERSVKASGQLALKAALGVTLATAASIDGWHPNRPGLLVLVAVPLVAVVLVDRRTSVTLSVICVVLAFVLPGSLVSTGTVHFVRISGIAGACAASAAAAFWRDRLATTRELGERTRRSARDHLLRGWGELPMQSGETSGGSAGPGTQHQRASSLLEVSRFDEEALEIALQRNDWERARLLARGLLGTWAEVVNLLDPSATSGAHSG